MTTDKAATVNGDVDTSETREWLESLDGVLQNEGADRAGYLLTQLRNKAFRSGVELPFSANTPYINTIPTDRQPAFPGNRDIERRIKSLVRWNAMAMVVRANLKDGTLGGHISTFASCATLYVLTSSSIIAGTPASACLRRGRACGDAEQSDPSGHQQSVPDLAMSHSEPQPRHRSRIAQSRLNSRAARRRCTVIACASRPS